MAPKPKKRARKSVTSVASVAPKVAAVKYLIEDVPAEMETSALHAHCNELGTLGWKLANVGSVVHGTPNLIRLWWTQ